jgi:hypothetical protein
MMLTHLGLRITILLMPAIPIENATRSPRKDYHAIADLSFISPVTPILCAHTGSYNILDARTDKISDDNKWDERKQLVLGVLNILPEWKPIEGYWFRAIALQWYCQLTSPI